MRLVSRAVFRPDFTAIMTVPFDDVFAAIISHQMSIFSFSRNYLSVFIIAKHVLRQIRKLIELSFRIFESNQSEENVVESQRKILGITSVEVRKFLPVANDTTKVSPKNLTNPLLEDDEKSRNF